MAMYLNALINFFSIEGRLNRRQYCLIWILTVIVGMIITTIIASILRESLQAVFAFVPLIFLVLRIPSDIKRLHDMHHSGWVLFWVMFFSLIPTLGLAISFIYTLTLLFVSGDEEKNKYGELPEKEAEPLEKAINKETKNALEATKAAYIASVKKVSDSIQQFKGSQSNKENEIESLKQKIRELEIQKLEKRIQDLEKQLNDK